MEKQQKITRQRLNLSCEPILDDLSIEFLLSSVQSCDMKITTRYQALLTQIELPGNALTTFHDSIDQVWPIVEFNVGIQFSYNYRLQ